MLKLILIWMIVLISCKEEKEIEKISVIETKPKKRIETKKTTPTRIEKHELPVALIGQLAKGIRKIKDKKGPWFYCGKELNEQEKIDISTAISYNVVLNMTSIGLDVDPYGILGTMFNESRFDACALGYYPRKKAYELNILKKRKRGIIHNREEILGVIKNKKMQNYYRNSGFDLGLCQILSRYYRGQEEDMLTLKGGVRICIIEMKSRARRFKTKTPWLYWRGKKTPWYLSKINRWKKEMK